MFHFNVIIVYFLSPFWQFCLILNQLYVDVIAIVYATNALFLEHIGSWLIIGQSATMSGKLHSDDR